MSDDPVPNPAPGELGAWRKQQRALLLARRESVAPAQRQAWSESITRLLIDGFEVLERASIGFYWPFKGEFDPRFAIRHWRERGARAALPIVVAKKAPLEFRKWWPGVTTVPGVFDLPIPQGTETIVPDVLLIPPVGFDRRGYRLGYGGGYFDRTLAARSPQPLKLAVAFELSRIPTIHPQPYDIPMDFVVTERGIHHVGSEGLVRVADPAEVTALVDRIRRGRPSVH